MALPVTPPIAPMLAKAAHQLPQAEGLSYEPKWDGFRCIAFCDSGTVELASRNEKPLNRYFPELVRALPGVLPERCVVDGEIVVAGPGGLDFDALSQRIHPAASRVAHLAEQTPASFVAFDLLALGDADLRDHPYHARRRALEGALEHSVPPVHLTPMTRSFEVASDWFRRFEGAGLDGVVAKGAELRYEAGKRLMVKVKHERTADCVVGGFRTHKEGGVGSLLLGLFDDRHTLHHVGVASGFSRAQRQELVEHLRPYLDEAGAAHPWLASADGTPADSAPADRAPADSAPADAAPADSASSDAPRADTAGGPSGRVPGGESRWSGGKDLRWQPIRPEPVAEVAYDHLQQDRFRHATRLVRWRPDRSPASCAYSQLESPVPAELADVFGSRG